MTTQGHDQRTRRRTREVPWGALVIVGAVLLFLHNSARASPAASAWVTALAIIFALVAVSAALVSVVNRR